MDTELLRVVIFLKDIVWQNFIVLILKNVHAKRPPQFNPNDPEDLNEWGEELEQMTSRRRVHNERHRPGKTDK